MNSLGSQSQLFQVKSREQYRNRCAICRGHRRLCNKSVCPILLKAKALLKLEPSLRGEKIFGSSPPAVFVGSWNYPQVFAGPLVPPSFLQDTAVMDLPELWLDKSFDEILRYRLSLVRGKRFVNVRSANNPARMLSTFQEIVLASKPTDTEMWFNKRPRLSVAFSSREPPAGPSASIVRAMVTENSSVPRPIDHVVSDTDLKAEQGVLSLYNDQITQRQITRIFSVGLLGVKKQRRLVPTEWSITAIDDILGRALHKKIIHYPWINKHMVFGKQALANNIQILLFPSSWMFEAQEAWLTSSNPIPGVDHEFLHGRRSYAKDLAGAYYASRLPVLEYLARIRRQAGALVLMEVYPEWIPLGVWRFREICREALKTKPMVCNDLNEALLELARRLRLPLRKWVRRSPTLEWIRSQTRITTYLSTKLNLRD